MNVPRCMSEFKIRAEDETWHIVVEMEVRERARGNKSIGVVCTQ